MGWSAQHANVLCDVLFADEIAHVVLVSQVVFLLVVLLLLLIDLSELPAGQLCDLTENLSNVFALRLNRHATELVLHLGNDTLCPPTDLIVDQLHVLLALLQTFEVTLQLLIFGL